MHHPVRAVSYTHLDVYKRQVPVIGVLFKVFFKVTESGNTTHKNSYLRKNRFNLYYAYAVSYTHLRDEGVRGYRQDHHGVRTDERATRSTYESCPGRTYNGLSLIHI